MPCKGVATIEVTASVKVSALACIACNSLDFLNSLYHAIDMLKFSHGSASVKKIHPEYTREEGRPQSLAVIGDLSEDQIACSHAPFITLRMQRSMRKFLLGLANLPRKGSTERCLLNSNYSGSNDALANTNCGPWTYYMHVKSTVAIVAT